MEGDRGRQRDTEHQSRAPHLSQEPPPEPAGCHLRHGVAATCERSGHPASPLARGHPRGTRPGRRLGLRRTRRPLAPERARDPRFARCSALLGRRACALARTREVDHYGLPRRPARLARARRAARARRDGHAHDRRFCIGCRYARALAGDRARHALSLAESHFRPAGRRDRRHGPPCPTSSRTGPPPSRPSPPPRPERTVAALAVGRRCLRWAAAVPICPRRLARRDLAAPDRVRPRPDRRVQFGPGAHHHRHRPGRRLRARRLPPHRLRRAARPPAPRRERPRDPRRGPRHDRPSRPEGELTMFGLDTWLAGFSDGTTLLVVALVAVVLGLRHATDPDHLAAVTTLIAGTEERASRAAARLGLAWGLGHATSLFAFGVPVVLFKAYLPTPVEQAAETSVGLLIVGLAIWLLVRWQRG